MKKLLSSMGILIIGAGALGSMPIVSQSQIKAKNIAEPVRFYWNEKHTEEVSKVVVDNHYDVPGFFEETKKTVFTVNLGVKKPKFTNLSFVNSTGFKAIWHGQDKVWNPSKIKINFENENYYQFKDSDGYKDPNFDKFITTQVYEYHPRLDLTPPLQEKADFVTKIGNVWYNEDDVYYMQILLYQDVDIAISWDKTATNYVSLGDQLELTTK